MSDEIKALEKQEKKLNLELLAVRRRLRKARVDASEFKVGDVVLARRRRAKKLEEAIILEVEPKSWASGSWYRVGWRKKGGEWGKQRERVFDDVKRLP